MRRTSPRALSAVVLAGLIAGSAATTAYANPATGAPPHTDALRQNSGPPGAVPLRRKSGPTAAVALRRKSGPTAAVALRQAHGPFGATAPSERNDWISPS
ncbi:hypothetical protein ACWEGQ_35140, partial [Streptomyces seoulensis]